MPKATNCRPFAKSRSGRSLRKMRRLCFCGRRWFSGGAPMWKVETRCTYDRKGLRYPTDMTDPEWELARPFVDVAQSRSGQRRVDLREVLNAVFYILGTGCQWRALPKDLAPAQHRARLFCALAV